MMNRADWMFVFWKMYAAKALFRQALGHIQDDSRRPPRASRQLEYVFRRAQDVFNRCGWSTKMENLILERCATRIKLREVYKTLQDDSNTVFIRFKTVSPRLEDATKALWYATKTLHHALKLAMRTHATNELQKRFASDKNLEGSRVIFG